MSPERAEELRAIVDTGLYFDYCPSCDCDDCMAANGSNELNLADGALALLVAAAASPQPSTGPTREDVLDELRENATRILDASPPPYAYGDNEAACRLADLLGEMGSLIDGATADDSPLRSLPSGASSGEAPLRITGHAEALEKFDVYFTKNYPGPNTIIGDPHWHAPKIFRAVLHALTTSQPSILHPQERRAMAKPFTEMTVEKLRREIVNAVLKQKNTEVLEAHGIGQAAHVTGWHDADALLDELCRRASSGDATPRPVVQGEPPMDHVQNVLQDVGGKLFADRTVQLPDGQSMQGSSFVGLDVFSAIVRAAASIERGEEQTRGPEFPHLLDLYKLISVEWGENPFPRLELLLEFERRASLTERPRIEMTDTETRVTLMRGLGRNFADANIIWRDQRPLAMYELVIIGEPAPAIQAVSSDPHEIHGSGL